MLISSKIKNGFNGKVLIPGDKSISHRSIIIPSISNGTSEINNILWSDDVIKTLEAFTTMGVKIDKYKDNLIIDGKGLNSLKKPNKKIDLGNSGTSARLLIGLLASQKFESILTGDSSLSKRPMERITKPLELMGAEFQSTENLLPIKILGKDLKKINYKLILPSAQVKSGIILAALNTSGKSIIKETKITRNHTEIMLDSFGADINVKKNNFENIIEINGKKELNSKNISVPSDLSSASFFIVATLINPCSKLKIDNLNLNPTRDGVLKALKIMGARINIKNKRYNAGELIGDLEVETSELRGCVLEKDIAKFMIDEFPILSIAASFAKSPSIFKGLGELKVKESNRLELIRLNLNKCGINCKIIEDDLYIDPSKKTNLKENNIKTDFDHRIAMSFAVMGSKEDFNLNIENPECIKTSFPSFINIFNEAGGNLFE